ncbi:MAG: hypothetical protein RLZZ455_340 [Candidatus Parcubacteria bacterium]|jgi:hypothetical protein
MLTYYFRKYKKSVVFFIEMGIYGLTAIVFLIIWLGGAALSIANWSIHLFLVLAIALFAYRYFTKSTIQ